MRRFLSYICYMITACLMMPSCIMDDFEETAEKENITLQFQLSVPLGDAYTKAQEAGNEYETTIPATNSSDAQNVLHFFVFDQTSGKFIQEAEILSISSGIASTLRVVKCQLPISYLGKSVRLVVMANYDNRFPGVLSSGTGYNFTNYTELHGLTFLYGDSPWSIDDGQVAKYIPMSGQLDFTLAQNMNIKIDLTRAVAKVRLKVKNGCPYAIVSCQTHNASESGFCLPQDPFKVPAPNKGLYDQLNYENLNIQNETDYFEFYLPEQTYKQSSNPNVKPTYLMLYMSDGGANPPVEFKYYPNGQKYNIRRNFVYEYVVNKTIDNSMADVEVNIMPWQSHDINTNYE